MPVSRPARGAGIEIGISETKLNKLLGRAPQGARGLKLICRPSFWVLRCRAPQGARGLKSRRGAPRRYVQWSRPARGAWVEIGLAKWWNAGRGSRPARGAGIETLPGFRYRIPPQKGSLCRSAETSFSFSIFTCRSSGLRSRHFSRPGGPWRGAGLRRSAGSARSRAHAGI